mgnify:CR=1 FL=1
MLPSNSTLWKRRTQRSNSTSELSSSTVSKSLTTPKPMVQVPNISLWRSHTDQLLPSERSVNSFKTTLSKHTERLSWSLPTELSSHHQQNITLVRWDQDQDAWLLFTEKSWMILFSHQTSLEDHRELLLTEESTKRSSSTHLIRTSLRTKLMLSSTVITNWPPTRLLLDSPSHLSSNKKSLLQEPPRVVLKVDIKTIHEYESECVKLHKRDYICIVSLEMINFIILKQTQ